MLLGTGWKKSEAAANVTLLPFRLVGDAVPSPYFAEAAQRWNSTLTADNKAPLGLPEQSLSQLCVAEKTTLLDDKPEAGKSASRKSSGGLSPNTQVEVLDKSDAGPEPWRKVVIVSGPLSGKLGWVKAASLSATKKKG
jgi:hypothetical protein